MKQAMRARDTLRLGVIRALKTAVTHAAIEKGGPDTPLDDAEILAIVRKQVKQRQDSVTQFTDAGRAELADKEQAEIDILEGYLPEPLDAAEIERLVEEVVAEIGASSRADMGKVMGLLQQRCGGRADGKTLSAAVAKRLA
jgi:uncharacterized protein YqeY